jgi:Meiotically up-regulated gene 113
MRFFFIGPRIFGIRPGISFGPNDFRKAFARTSAVPAEPMTGGFVYAIRGDHNMIKIGMTTNPRARLAQLRTGSAFPIDYAYLAVSSGEPAEVEAAAHTLLDKHRCNGEWFDVAPEMAVAAIAGAAHKLGQSLLPVTVDTADQILQICSAGGGPSSSNRYLFGGLPWWLRWPLQAVGGLICGAVTFAAVYIIIVIASAP